MRWRLSGRKWIRVRERIEMLKQQRAQSRDGDDNDDDDFDDDEIEVVYAQ